MHTFLSKYLSFYTILSSGALKQGEVIILPKSYKIRDVVLHHFCLLQIVVDHLAVSFLL